MCVCLCMCMFVHTYKWVFEYDYVFTIYEECHILVNALEGISCALSKRKAYFSMYGGSFYLCLHLIYRNGCINYLAIRVPESRFLRPRSQRKPTQRSFPCPRLRSCPNGLVRVRSL